MSSCNDSSNPVVPINNNFVYPLEVGNSWSYNSSYTHSNIRPDSLKDILEECMADLKVIECETMKIHVPLSYSEELYNLRLHIELVATRIKAMQEREIN